MRVNQILKMKANVGVLSVSPDSTLGEAIEILAKKRIGAVVVSPDGKALVGILSERDIVRELARSGANCTTMKVSEVMTADPVTSAPEDESEALFQVMTDGRFRHLPVMHDGEMIGLISIGDVVKAQLSELSMQKDALEGMIMGH